MYTPLPYTGEGIGDLGDGLDMEDTEEVVLPPQKRSGNHSLNLVTSVNALKAREDKNYQRIC